MAVGKPTAWLAGRLPFAHLAHQMTSFITPNPTIAGPGAFTAATTAANGGVPPVTTDAFDPATIGAPAPPKRRLRTLLVTGDSMSMPLDEDLAQSLAPDGVHVIQDPHIGTGISNTVLVNWGQLAAYQVRHDHPDAVVMFIGANDGYTMPGPGGHQVNCCSVQWTALYAQRAREMMSDYRQAGAAHVYWLTLPTPRETARQQIARVVNAAIAVAAQPWAAQVHVIDTVPTFTPGGRYRDAMTINGTPTIVRQSDGIHLNDAGSRIAAQIVLNDIRTNFTL